MLLSHYVLLLSFPHNSTTEQASIDILNVAAITHADKEAVEECEGAVAEPTATNQH